MLSRHAMSQPNKEQQQETKQSVSPEQEITQDNNIILQRSSDARAGDTNASVRSHIQNLPPQQRQQAILQLQHTHGNAYVQRMLNAKPLIQRAPANIQRAPGGLQQGVKFAAPEFNAELDVPIPGIPLKWTGVKIGGEVSFSAEEKGDSNTQVGVQGSSDGHAGVYGETVLHEWGKWSSDTFGEISVISKGEAELTTNGGQIGLVAGALKIGKANLGLKFNLIGYDVEKTEVQWPNLSLSAEYTAFSQEVVTADGTKLTLEIKPKISYIFTPDYVRIGEWLAERYATQALIGLGAAAGILAAGAAAIAPAMVQASLGRDIMERIDQAAVNTKKYAMGYAAAIRGEDPGPFDYQIKGAEAAKDVIKKADLPAEAFHKAAKERNLMAEAIGAAWPVIKEEILRQYKEEHWFEMMMYGELSAPGYKTLKAHLDEPTKIHFDRMYVVGEDDFQW